MHDKHIRPGTDRLPEHCGSRVEGAGYPLYVPVTFDYEADPPGVPLLCEGGRCDAFHEGDKLRNDHCHDIGGRGNQRFITISNTKHL